MAQYNKNLLMLLILGSISVVYTVTFCSNGWTRYDQSCYAVPNSTSMYTWANAHQLCMDMDADLVVVNSQSENNFIWTMQRDHFPADKAQNIWLGCTNPIGAAGWQCSDEKDMEYSNFIQSNEVLSEKELTWREDRCLTMTYSIAGWGTPACDDKKHVLCEQKLCPRAPFRCFPVPTIDSTHQEQHYCLTGHALKKIHIQNPIQCCLACSKDPNCRSFNLTWKTCLLNNATISQVDHDKYTISRENCVYYEYE